MRAPTSSVEGGRICQVKAVISWEKATPAWVIRPPRAPAKWSAK